LDAASLSARLAQALAGVLLISVGLLVTAGWPFVVGGLILLLAAARVR
jgi:hypothetical protein